MDLKGLRLDKWFLELEGTHSLSLFPHGENYFNKYKNYSEQLFKWVHPEVAAGSGNADKSLLTNHGNDHIYTVITRATQLVSDNDYCELSPFEVYVLLMVIHVHDVGNIKGRDNHEFNNQEIIDYLGSGVVNQETWVWDYIFEIAKAHKGYQIETLANEDYLHEIPIRPQFLAALLKFADELAENFSRASNILIKLDEVPDENKLFHVFASTINSILPRPQTREILMLFNIREDQLIEEYLSDGEKVFLVDEIYSRTLKTHSERVYCMKFLRPQVNFDSIKVTLNIKLTSGVKVQFGYELAEQVVTNVTLEEVLKLCPNLKDKCGVEIKAKVEEDKLKEHIDGN